MAESTRPKDTLAFLLGYLTRKIAIIGFLLFFGLAIVLAIGAAIHRLLHGTDDGSFLALWRIGFGGSDTKVGESVATYGFGVVILFFLAIFIRQVSKKHIAEFGPTIGGWSATAVMLGLPALALLASWSGAAASTQTIPRAASLGTLAVIVIGMAIAAGASLVTRRPADTVTRLMSMAPVRWMTWLVRCVVSVNTYVLTFADIGLVRVIALISGAALPSAPKRYAGFLIPFGIAIAAVIFAPGNWWQIASVWAGLSVLSLWRSWSWVEADRQRFLEVRSDEVGPHTGIRLGFREDYRDEALVAMALALLVLLPVTLARLNVEHGLYNGASGGPPTSIEWMTFIGGELAKAIPMMDWSEIYGIQTALGVQPTGSTARHVVFSLRVIMDLLMIGTLIQTITTRIRLDDQRRRFANPNDPLDLLDPFEERTMFAQCAEDWTAVEGLRAYSPDRLEALIGRGGERPMMIGAARIAGWQLAVPVMRLLLESVSDQFQPFRNECAAGLQRRADQIARSGRPDPSADHVIAALLGTGRTITPEINEALARIEKRRKFDLQIVRIGAAATGLQPQSRRAFQELCTDADRDAVLALVRDPAATTREAAYLVLAERSDVPLQLLIEGLSDQSVSVRKAVVLAMRTHHDVATVRPLITALAAANDDDLKKMIIERLGQLGDPSAISVLASLASARSPLSRVSGWPSFEGTQWRDLSWYATWAIGQIGAEHAAEALNDVLVTQHPMVVDQAAEALAAGTAVNSELASRHLRRMLREIQARPRLIQRLPAFARKLAETTTGRPHDWVEEACASLFRAIKPSEEQVALGREMLEPARHDRVRLHAVYCLANSAIAASRAPLEAAAASDPNDVVRLAAAIALASYHRDSAAAASGAVIEETIADERSQLRALALQQLPCLPVEREDVIRRVISERAWRDNNAVLMGTLATMGRIGYSGAPHVIVEGLASTEIKVRSWAAFAAGLIGDLSLAGPVLDRLQDGAAGTRCQAMLALSRLGVHTAVDAIDAVLAKDPSVRVQRAGAIALLGLAPSHPRAATVAGVSTWLAQNMVSREACFWVLAEGHHRDDDVFWAQFENDPSLTVRMLAARARAVIHGRAQLA